MATLFASDSHFGLDLPDAERTTEAVHAIAKNGQLGVTDIVVPGDLILGWKQKNESPDWKGRFDNDAGAWVDLLRERGATVIAGNCEHQPEMDMLGLGQMPYSSYDEQTGIFVTHGHIAEPRSPIELVRNLPPAMAKKISFGRSALEKVLGTKNEACFDTANTIERLQLSMHNAPELQTILEDIDRGHHQASTSLYSSLAGVADKIPGLRKQFDAIVRMSLDDYYVRMLIHSVRELIQKEGIKPPRTIMYGHTHRPFILSKKQLQNTFDFDNGWLPDWIVNDGTMVPLTPVNGGTDESHFAIVGDDGIPVLYRTDNAPLVERINVGGETVSHKFSIKK